MGQHSDRFIKLLAETDNEELCNAFLDYQKERTEEIRKAIGEIKSLLPKLDHLPLFIRGLGDADITLAKASYKAKDGTIKPAITIGNKRYAPKNDIDE